MTVLFLSDFFFFVTVQRHKQQFHKTFIHFATKLEFLSPTFFFHSYNLRCPIGLLSTDEVELFLNSDTQV